MANYTISKITSPTGDIYTLKDAEARSLIAAMDLSAVGGDGKYIKLISEADGKVSATAESLRTTLDGSSIAPTSNAVKTYVDQVVSATTKFDFKIVTALPEASEDTRSSIYLMAHTHGTSDSYDEYVTIRMGAGTTADPYTYKWEKIGNTDIDLSGYIKGVSSTFKGTAGSHNHTASFKGEAVTPTAKTVTFTGTKATITPTATVTGASYTPEGSVSMSGAYTPKGTVAVTANDVTVSGDVSITPKTTTVLSSASLSGAVLPSLSFSCEDETLAISWSAGTIGSITTGTAAVLNSETTASFAQTVTPTIASATFTGTAATITASGSLVGTKATITPTVAITGATYTPQGSVSVTMNSITPKGTITVDNASVTPAGTIENTYTH